MANELGGAAAHVGALLEGDLVLSGLVGGRIYRDVAPESSVYPLVVWSLGEARDEPAVGADRAVTRVPCTCVGILDADDLVAASDIANSIDRLMLQDAPKQRSFGGIQYTVLGIKRQRPIQRTDPEGGVLYLSLGGVYRILMQAA